MSNVDGTLVIVDDHPSFRRTARAVLTAQGVTVVGDAPDGAAGIRLAERLRPDIVLVDIHLPDLDGFEVADALAALAEPPIVILISSRAEAAFAARIATSPVAGFLPKDRLSATTIQALTERR